eukprot:comp15337_c0_seq1/m.12189 comp15337_c0_seq1/g.12189  ORF comp15337_c0_seq1/g.12189 comp15337_c0_seq1/m.12189 type:complete len:1061 (-) comp15337_c0_seq1:614-3796(-)
MHNPYAGFGAGPGTGTKSNERVSPDVHAAACREKLLSDLKKATKAVLRVSLTETVTEEHVTFKNLCYRVEAVFTYGVKEKFSLIANYTPADRAWRVIEILGQTHHATSELVQEANRRSGSDVRTHPLSQWVRLALLTGRLRDCMQFFVREQVIVRSHYQHFSLLTSNDEVELLLDQLLALENVVIVPITHQRHPSEPGTGNSQLQRSKSVSHVDVGAKLGGEPMERQRSHGNSSGGHPSKSMAAFMTAGKPASGMTPTQLYNMVFSNEVERKLLFGASGVCGHVDAEGILYAAKGYLSLFYEDGHKTISWTPSVSSYHPIGNIGQKRNAQPQPVALAENTAVSEQTTPGNETQQQQQAPPHEPTLEPTEPPRIVNLPVRGFRVQVRQLAVLKYHRDAKSTHVHENIRKKYPLPSTPGSKESLMGAPSQEEKPLIDIEAPGSDMQLNQPKEEKEQLGEKVDENGQKPVQESGNLDRKTENSGPQTEKNTEKQPSQSETPSQTSVKDTTIDKGFIQLVPRDPTQGPFPVLHFHDGQFNAFMEVLGRFSADRNKKRTGAAQEKAPSMPELDAMATTFMSTWSSLSKKATKAMEGLAAAGRKLSAVDSDPPEIASGAVRQRVRVPRVHQEIFLRHNQAAMTLYQDYEEHEVTYVDEEYRTSLMDGQGRFKDEATLRKSIFYHGIHPSVRHDVWKYLLGLYSTSMTEEERDTTRQAKKVEYEALRAQWQNDPEVMEALKSDRDVIEKDVVRTDRKTTFYKGDGNSNLATMVDILHTYLVYHPEMGYVQGMSDLLAPILAVIGDESDAFWCFVGYMTMMKSVYMVDDQGMQAHIQRLHQLLEAFDPDLRSFIDHQGVSHMFFSYRWFMLNFKREFDHAGVMKLWEIIWSNHLTPYFHLYVGLSILLGYRDALLSGHLAGNDILEFISNLSSKMDIDDVLQRAKAYALYSKSVEVLPTQLRRVLFPEDCQTSPDFEADLSIGRDRYDSTACASDVNETDNGFVENSHQGTSENTTSKQENLIDFDNVPSVAGAESRKENAGTSSQSDGQSGEKVQATPESSANLIDL